jgi:hypothetical protein
MEDLLPVLLATWVGLAWLTHVITCIAASKWVLLVVGAFVFPVGCVHGTGIWFGAF